MLVRWLAGLSILLLLVLGSAHHRPGHPTPPGQTTTTVATTTTIATTTTTVATTTTTAPTTTTTLPNLNLTADLVITSDTTLTGQIEGNGFQILIDGANVTMTDLTVNNVNRIMWHGACGVATLNNVLVTNSGVLNELGAYPLHWHMCGDATRGTTVNGVTVRDSNFRAFVPHGSNGITFTNIATDTILGESFWWDDPGTNRVGDPDPECQTRKRFCTLDNSDDIVVDGATFSGSYWSRDIEPCCGRWHALPSVVLQPGVGNIMRNVQVLNTVGGKNASAFHWPETANNNAENVGWLFENNSSDTSEHGIFVWQNDSFDHMINGFTGGGINHGAYENFYHYQNVSVPYLNAHALGWSMSDSHVGAFSSKPHNTLATGGVVTLTNVTFDTFEIKETSVGGTFIINGTNITCADIIWTSVAPDTSVVIDGVGC